jgi:glycosyltransferase involved in cell wall biosynthesis
VGGIPDIVENNVNGYLVEPGNPEQLADRLIRLLRDADLRARFGETNKTASRRYRWEDIAQQTLNMYESLSSRKKL